MARIPQYEQRVPVRIDSPRATGGVGAGLVAVGNAISDVQDERERKRLVLEQKREQDGVAWATEQLATVRSSWAAEFQKRAQEAPPGAAEFTPSVLKDFDTQADELVKQAPTPRVKQVLRDRLNDVRLGLQSDAMQFEARAGVDHRRRLAGSAVEQARLAVDARPASFVPALQELYLGAANIGLTPQEEAAFREDAKLQLAYAAVQGAGRRDPYGMLKQLTAEKPSDPAVAALDLDGKQRARGFVQSEISRREAEARARQAEQRDLLRTDVADAFAQRQMGLPATMPTKARYVAAYGADGAARYTADSQKWQAFDVAGRAALLPPEEAAKELDRLKGGGSQDGAADRLEAYSLATRLYAKQRQALEADPAAVLLQREPELRALFESGQDDPENLRAYVMRMRAVQETLGVEKPQILPAAMAAQYAADLAANPDQPGARAAKLQQMAAAWGPAWTDVLRQVAPQLEGTARVMTNMRPSAARALDIAVSQDLTGAAKALPEGETSTIETTLADEFVPFAESLADNTDAEARLDEHYAAARSLALSYRLRGMSADEAARTAFAHVVGEQYEFRGRARIPRAFDADAVMDGASKALDAVQGEALRIQAAPFSDSAQAQKDLKSLIARRGEWTTAPDGSGLVLRIPTRTGRGTVVREDGTPVQYSWSELQRMAEDARSFGAPFDAKRQAGLAP